MSAPTRVAGTFFRWPIAGTIALALTTLGAFGQPIHVSNYNDTHTINYPLALLRGTLQNTNLTTIQVINESSTRSTRQMDGLARSGQFRGLAELVPGTNNLRIIAGADELIFTLFYKPQTNPRIVRPVLYTLANGDTNYSTPLTSDPQNFREKLATMMKIMQTFTAESMHDQGYPRLTFNLPLDPATGEVEVFTLRSDHDAAFYHNQSYDRSQLWYEAVDLISRQIPNALAKNVVIVAFSRYDAALGYKYAHTALGGGNVGLMGGLSLWAVPSSLDHILSTYMDGSTAYPQIQGESASVHLAANEIIGAAMHELGHSLGRPHEGVFDLSIMQRGFDRMYRMFTLAEPNGTTWDPLRVGNWAPESATAFANNHLNFQYPPPVADIVDVAPDPLSDDARFITVRFDQPVSGVTVSDFSLDFNGSPVTSFLTTASIAAVAPGEYRLDLAGLTQTEGIYTLRLGAAGSGIVNANSFTLMDDQSETWTRSADGPPILDQPTATDVTHSAATLRGRLASAGGRTTFVNILWGTADGGTNLAAWQHLVSLGARGRGDFSQRLLNLAPEQRIVFRAYASNELGIVWSDAATVTTRQLLLLASTASASWRVPPSSADDATWFQPSFSDATWSVGAAGFGYETSGTEYRALIVTDVVNQMRNVNTSLRTRFRFDAPNRGFITAATLKMRYDDGFVAYLNGVAVARGNAAAGHPAWNAAATALRNETDAVVPQSFDLTPYIQVLQDSGNVLAIQALNDSLSSSDLLMVPEISASAGVPTNLISAGAPVRALVPSDGNLGTTWTAPGFNAATWLQGMTGVGYERSTGYESLISLNLNAQMYNRATTVYLRIPFVVANPFAFTELKLRMKYDDAYIAYLNGVEVARTANAPANAVWNSAASSIHDDAQAVVFQDVDISSRLGLLGSGTNFLAIHGLNDSTTSSDFLILPELVAYRPQNSELPVFEMWIAGFAVADSSRGGDPDGDGVSNENEWLADSNPGVPDATLHRTTIQRRGDGAMMLRFRAVAGRSYQVRYSAELGLWLDAGPALAVTENNPQQTWIDDGGLTGAAPPNVHRRFYQVIASFTMPR